MRLRSDRWGDDPVLNKNGEPAVVRRPTDRDIEIFRLLNRYRALDPRHIALFLLADIETIRKRLKILQRKPNRYLDFYNLDKQERRIGLNGYQWYCLSERGRDALREEGIDPTEHGNGSEFEHEIGVQAAIASLEIGATAAGAEMFFPTDIIAHENFPAATRNDTHSPWSVPVSISKRFEHGTHNADFRYRGDGFLWHKRNGVSHFFNVEFENKNRATSTNFNSTSFLKKFLALEYIRKHGLCERRWGIPQQSFFTLVLATSQHHVDAMKQVVIEETNKRGSEYILFYVFPALHKSASVKPMPELYTSPWQRAGYSPLSLHQLEE